MTTTQTRAPAAVEGAVPPDALTLLPLPDLEELDDARARGAACLWGGEPLTGETAADLGERTSPESGTTLFLRSCRTCLAHRAHRALHRHRAHCPLCRPEETSPDCVTGGTLHRLLTECRR